jgi:hypothetical protein
MQTVVKYMHRETRGWETRIPERASNPTELKPASKKTKGAWSWRIFEGLRGCSEFGTLLEGSNRRSFLHPPRLHNCCSPRIRILAHPNRAQGQTESIYQHKRYPYEALTKDVAKQGWSQLGLPF